MTISYTLFPNLIYEPDGKPNASGCKDPVIRFGPS